MKNFNDRRDGGFKGKPSFNKKPWDGDRQTTMYKATCSECGKSCEVPFRPTGEKPVYCNDCFNKKRDPSDSRGAKPPYGGSNSSPSFTKRDFNDRFAPRPDRSDNRTERPAFKPDNTAKQLSDISIKLDRIITVIEKMGTPKSDPIAVAKVEKVSTAKVAVKSSPRPKFTPPKAGAGKVAKKK